MATSILSLPDELSLRILHQLEYKELKRMRRVCKLFHRLVQDSSFDATLFRQPVQPLKENMEALMHPFLQKWNPLNVISSDRVRALTLSCLAEFATSPAVSFIVVEFAEKPQIVREEGVTVRDVIEEMADAFEACKSVYVDSDAEDLSGAQVCTWHDFYWEDETAYYNWHGWEKPDVVMVD